MTPAHLDVTDDATVAALARQRGGSRYVVDGAASVRWAVDLPDEGPSGGFVRDGRPIPW